VSAPHFLVFVGAGASLSTELAALKRRFQDLEVVAPAAAKQARGISNVAVQDALNSLALVLRKQGSTKHPAKLTVWAYGPDRPDQFLTLWECFGRSSWIELLPEHLVHKDGPTRIYIQNRLESITGPLHEVSHQIYNRRKTSPFSIPLSNFKSAIIARLSEHWYNGANTESLQKLIEKISRRFRQLHTTSTHAHRDDRSLIFSPAADEACHGIAHPMGNTTRCFVNGRFRFGAALYPGFHYDVRHEAGPIESTLTDCMGNRRDMRPERKRYINIFPNDHLLPEN
jgi:hypothetical protein